MIADGPSDRKLLPILRWSLRRTRPEGLFLDAVFIPRRALPIAQIVEQVTALYDPGLIFVHRDAERESYEVRRTEIPRSGHNGPVVPVRMTEAWLLIDESALRQASGKPNGKARLVMPPVERLESLPDPKGVLEDLLLEASGSRGRRRRRFDRDEAA